MSWFLLAVDIDQAPFSEEYIYVKPRRERQSDSDVHCSRRACTSGVIITPFQATTGLVAFVMISHNLTHFNSSRRLLLLTSTGDGVLLLTSMKRCMVEAETSSGGR